MSKINKDKNVLLIKQDLKIIRSLAHNENKIRNQALKLLKKWFQVKSETTVISENRFMRIWKGLFYAMWMADKPLIQEEWAEKICKVLNDVPQNSNSLFFKCGMKTLMNEWSGIDQLRLNKFLMFVRRLLRQALMYLRSKKWLKTEIKTFTQALSQTILNPSISKPIGLFFHFSEIYLEELSKISEGKLKPSLVVVFINPFIKHLVLSKEQREIGSIRQFVFNQLIKQSNLGLDYQEKYRAWRQLGFPGSIESLKKVVVADDNNSINNNNNNSEEDDESVEKLAKEKRLDPRAGRVDVNLPQIKFNTKQMIEALNKHKFLDGSTTKSRKVLTSVIEQFKKLDSGNYPFKTKKVKADAVSYNVRKSAKKLIKFENKIRDNKLKNRKRKNNEESSKIEEGNSNESSKQKKLQNGQTDIEQIINKQVKNRKRKNNKESSKIEEENSNESSKQKKLQNGPSNIEQIIKKEVANRKRKNSEEINNCFKQRKLNEHQSDVKQIFKRNSGTWFVFDFAPPEIENVKVLTPKTNSVKKIRRNNTLTKSQELPAANKNIKTLTPGSDSVKKLRINTTLNRSQELIEHEKLILSSPLIPYNADKKPSKPILKLRGAGPIYPFLL